MSKLGDDDMVELYMYWLKGGKIEYKPEHNDYYVEMTQANLEQDPYTLFINIIDIGCKIRKKKCMVEQTLWVCSKPYMDGEYSYRPEVFTEKDHVTHDAIIEAGYAEHNDMIKQDWHCVPTYTRKVEVDE